MNDPAPTPRENQGKPEPRIDGRIKVTGEARYSADEALAGLAHAVLVTSSISRGVVLSVDVDAARNLPGVLDVLSYGDLDDVEPPSFGTSGATSLAPLSQRDIVHDGQIVALVVADTFEAASEGAEQVRVRYDEQAASGLISSTGTERIDAVGNTERHKEDPSKGNFDTAFAAAPIKLEAEYHTASEMHNPIELFSTTCVWADDRLTVYEPTQNVFGFRAELARQLGIDVTKVRVVSRYIGGGFGSKGPMSSRTAIVAVAARRLGRPVRCVVSRSQSYTTTTYRAETQHRLRLGANPNGNITAFSHDADELTSRTDNYVVGGTDTTARMYGYGAVASKVQLVKTDRQTPGYMRSPPETPYMFPLECALDELAEKLKLDPVELRRINDTMTDPISGKPYSSRSLMQCYGEASQAFGWDKRDPAVRSMRDGDWLVGYGCATAVYPTHVAAAAVRVRLTGVGKVRVQTASHEIGTGIRTVAAQMAAERLGADIADVQVEMGDSDLPPAPVAGGSNTTASICSTILKACDAIRARLFNAVATQNNGPLSGYSVADLDLASGTVVASNGDAMALQDAFKALGTAVIEEYSEFVPGGAEADAVAKLYAGRTSMTGGSDGDKLKYGFGAQFVEVRVNARTREIRVPRMVGAFAAGRIMNTRTARSQLMGGMIWGLGAALLEETQVDPRNARYVNRDLQDYLIAVNADVGRVDVILVPEIDNEVNPAGVKGIGELGNIGVPSAIANAVYHATGVRARRMPIRIEELLVEV